MTDDLRTRIAAVQAQHHHWDYAGALTCACGEDFGLSDTGWEAAVQQWAQHVADAVIRELPALQYTQVPQRIMLSHASQAAESRRLDAASWLEKELASAGLNCGAGWVLYNLVDGLVARLNGVSE